MVLKRVEIYYYEFELRGRRYRESTRQRNPRVARQMESARLIVGAGSSADVPSGNRMGQDGEGFAQSPHDGENHRDRVISRDEELRYLMAAPALLRDVATILLDCGLRPEKCFRVRVENIRDGALHITYGKTRAARRRIPMTPRVSAIVESRMAASVSVWLFPAPTRSGHMEGSSVKKQQTRVFRVTGIKQFELYCLRHTCQTRWAPKMDPFTLAYLAGHSDISITKRYVHPEDETVRAAMERATFEQLSPPSALQGEMAAVSSLAAIN